MTSEEARDPSRYHAMSIIHAEHRSLSAVLWSLNYLARETRIAPDFELLSLMIDYIEMFPERLHHPKEDQHLFTALRRRTPDADAHMIDDLRFALARYRVAGEARRAEFAAAVLAYVQFHWEHMRKEEEMVLPLAAQVLTQDDWQAIAAAFSESGDPLLGPEAQTALRALFQTILTLAPAPVGLGSARDMSQPTARSRR